MSVPLPPKLPSSIHFLALSQAPPAFDIIIAKTNPLRIAPAKKAPSATTPNKIPTVNGTAIDIILGKTSSFNEPLVAILIHLLKSAASSPFKIFGLDSNCLLISSTILAAFL